MRSTFKNFSTLLPTTSSFNSCIDKYVSTLNEFSIKGLFRKATALHGHLIKAGVSSERRIAIKLIALYLNRRRPIEADQIRNEFDGFDLVLCNYMISANTECGNLDEAQRLFDEMPDRNEVSWSALISGLMRHGKVKEAMAYFERNPFHNVVSWTAAITGLIQNGLNFEAVKCFRLLLRSGVRPNSVTFSSTLKACIGTGDLRWGMSVLGLIVKFGFEHNLSVCNSLITLFARMGEVDLASAVFDQMGERDVFSWTSILDMYAQIGDLAEARRIFDEMPERNEVSWSLVVSRYSQNGLPEEALKLFSEMVQHGINPNTSCLSSAISALTNLKALKSGMSFHAHVLKVGIEQHAFIGSSLIDLYCKCGNTRDGKLVFDSTLSKSVVCWNSMISGYSLNKRMEEAVELFGNAPVRNDVTWNSLIAGYVQSRQFDKVFEVVNDMLLSGQALSKSTFSSVLSVCACTASLEKGMNFHAKTIKLDFHRDIFLGTALTDMYAKCGDIDSSKQVFDRMSYRNDFSWTVMIQGLAENGFAKESIELFEEMKRGSSIAPSELMLLSVLFACSHSGLVKKGLEYFNSMEKIYGIKPKGRHYTCVVDMLCRSGRLSEAEKFINAMPFEPDSNAWAALLSACNKYGNEELAKWSARKLAGSSAGYVLLSNIYAMSGKWVDVMNVRRLMKEKGMKKNAGCSWVEVKNKIHGFYSEDGAHPQLPEIYEVLELLRSEMMLSLRSSPF